MKISSSPGLQPGTTSLLLSVYDEALNDARVPPHGSIFDIRMYINSAEGKRCELPLLQDHLPAGSKSDLPPRLVSDRKFVTSWELDEASVHSLPDEEQRLAIASLRGILTPSLSLPKN
jgi:hypothetical protein